MIPVVTPAEMAAIDAAAPEPVAVLIERAGAAVAAAALRLLGGGYGRRVVLLAGKGNNGHDGRVAARLLSGRGVRVLELDAVALPDRLPVCDLVLDAAYGTGFRGTFAAPATDAPVLAVDIPSGVSGLTGAVTGSALQATRTVTFGAYKPGLLLAPGRELAGEVVVASLGLDTSGTRAGIVTRDDVAAWMPPRAFDAHKWQAGVLVVAGAPGMGGAAELVAGAAQRAGAGMVRLGTPGDDDPARPVEAVAQPLPATGWGAVAAQAAERFASLAVGPGLGRADGVGPELDQFLRHTHQPAVVDADALSVLAGRDLGGLVAARRGPVVLTPHDGEFAALAGRPVGVDRFAAARGLSEVTQAVVLLKGPVTIVADPGGEVRVVIDGDARLATAGTGDVLTGVIAGLLARGLPALEAAAAGAWLHARAARHGSTVGLVASDLLPLLPAALAEVLV